MITATLLLHTADEVGQTIELPDAPIMLHLAHSMDAEAHRPDGPAEVTIGLDAVYRLTTRTWPHVTNPGVPATATYVFDHFE